MQQDVNPCGVKVQFARRNIGCVQLKQEQELSMAFLPASGLVQTGKGLDWHHLGYKCEKSFPNLNNQATLLNRRGGPQLTKRAF